MFTRAVQTILGCLLVTFGIYLTFKDQTLSKEISESEVQVQVLNYNYVIVMSMGVGVFLLLV